VREGQEGEGFETTHERRRGSRCGGEGVREKNTFINTMRKLRKWPAAVIVRKRQSVPGLGWPRASVGQQIFVARHIEQRFMREKQMAERVCKLLAMGDET
jgi:hypothetical protein